MAKFRRNNPIGYICLIWYLFGSVDLMFFRLKELLVFAYLLDSHFEMVRRRSFFIHFGLTRL
jgi:hypothetical protein